MFHSRLNLRHIKMVNVTQTTRKAAVQPSTSHSNMLCIRRAFAAQVQTKAAAREMIASTIHQKAVAEISTRSFAERRPASLAHSRSILSAIYRQIFSPSCSSVFLASSPSVTVLAPRREETAPSILGRASESLFSSFSTLALRMRTAS